MTILFLQLAYFLTVAYWLGMYYRKFSSPQADDVVKQWGHAKKLVYGLSYRFYIAFLVYTALGYYFFGWSDIFALVFLFIVTSFTGGLLLFFLHKEPPLDTETPPPPAPAPQGPSVEERIEELLKQNRK